MRITAFVITFALLALIPVVLKGIPFSRTAFSDIRPDVFKRMTVLHPYDLASVKVNHALSKPRFDVGVFGNSRVVAVGVKHLDIGDRSFFNFAVPGTSLRQSVNLVDELAAHGKAPKLSIISFDNLEIDQYGNAYYPSAFSRWWQAGRDAFWALVNRPGDMLLLAHIVLDHIYAEWEALTDTWNAKSLWARGAIQAPSLVPPLSKPRHAYISDGSRPVKIPQNNSVDRFERPQQRMILLSPYMARDIERLAALDGQSTRILIYETHLETKSASYFDANPSDAVIEKRRQFRTACERFGIACYTAKERPLPENGSPWEDCCHAPADAIGQLISGLVRKHATP
ncbi:MAG: hypothetical protein O2967_14360 [Proteobacteria bacterium]|nr:hypothetical protein [Pseudomonadota bacterium]